jgi:hypothetical protein
MAKLGVDLNGLSDPAEILATIGGYAASCPDSAVIRGSGWMAAYFENGSPTREMLDEVVGDRPAAILSSDREIHNVPVKLTMMDGRITHRDGWSARVHSAMTCS